MLPVLNTQPIEKMDCREDGSLDVVGVFDTIQGEGPFAGYPAVFVRLAGCTLMCPACDTSYTEGRVRYTPEELTSLGLSARPAGRPLLVVITGGEPFRQNLGPFVRKLRAANAAVQIETNGTLGPDDFPYLAVSLVCSPKAGKVAVNIARNCSHWKYVLQAGHVDPTDGLPLSVLGNGVRPFRPVPRIDGDTIWVQPMDEGEPGANTANLQACIKSAMKWGYRFSYQIHKAIGVA